MKTTLFLLAAVGMLSCGIEGPVINLAMRDKSTEIPKAADNVVIGLVEDAPAGTAVAAYGGAGTRLEGIGGTVGADGRFEVRFPGNTEFTGVRLDVRWPGGQAAALVPSLPRQASVLDPERLIDLSKDVPGLSPLSSRSLAFTLVILGAAIDQGRTVASLSPEAIRDSAAQLSGLLASGNDKVLTFVSMVDSLVKDAGLGKGTKYPFVDAIVAGARVRDLADEEFLTAHGITPQQFEDALLAAASEVSVAVCYAQDRIRVVLEVRFGPGFKDGNCQDADPFKWAQNLPGKSMFLAAGVHKDTPVCGMGDAQPPYCIDDATVDAANGLLQNWKPNLQQMYDDGTHGDAAKGDGIWTLALDLPYIRTYDDPKTKAPVRPGVRIGYKYTWGSMKQGWTGSEEWPGNQRLLELEDLDGDGLVVRLDVFGDEATNKDKANLLTGTNGGCGVNFWELNAKEGCGHDTRERKVDTDGDCKPDAWPAAGAVSPITVPCS